MIEWYWVLAALSGGAIFGVIMMGLIAGGGRSTLEDDNMRLREENAELKQMNHELRLFNSRQSGECAEGTEYGQ